MACSLLVDAAAGEEKKGDAGPQSGGAHGAVHDLAAEALPGWVRAEEKATAGAACAHVSVLARLCMPRCAAGYVWIAGEAGAGRQVPFGIGCKTW